MFTSLVRDLPVTPATMYATMELFVNLADGVFMHIDLCRSDCHDGLRDPIGQFPAQIARWASQTTVELIAQIAMDHDIIRDPTPMVYGLDRDPDITEPTRYPLALAIWKLLSQTAMATVRENRPGAFPAMLPPGPLRTAITGIAPLPEGTDVEALAHALDHRTPHGCKNLGTTILYVAGMTGNSYADTTHDELMDYYANYGLDWADLAQLAEIKEAQTEAITIGCQFHHLNDAFMTKPSRIVALFRTVHQIAAALRRTQARPKTLMQIYAPDPPKEDPFGTLYHPFDISRDIERDDDRGIDILGPVFVLSTTGLRGPDAPTVHHPAGVAAPAPPGGDPAE